MNERRSFLCFFGQNKPKKVIRNEKNQKNWGESVKIPEKREFLRFFMFLSVTFRPAFAAHGGSQNPPPRRSSLLHQRDLLKPIVIAALALGSFALARIVPLDRFLPLPFSSVPKLTVTERMVRADAMPKFIITEHAPWYLPWIAQKPFGGSIERIELVSPRQDVISPSFSTEPVGDGLEVTLVQLSAVHPGDYEARVYLQGESARLLTRHFRWGVVAVNVRSSIAVPGDHREVHIAVLDDYGRTECNSRIRLRLTDPNGIVSAFSTKDETILRNPDCKDRSVTNVPD